MAGNGSEDKMAAISPTEKLYRQDVDARSFDAVILDIRPAENHAGVPSGSAPSGASGTNGTGASGMNGTGASGMNGTEAYVAVLDRTAFFPEGGGQSCDTGAMGGWRVTDVQEENGVILHTIVPDPCSGDQAPLRPGDTVHCELDWQRRFDNMQRHCGEHILSGAFHRLFGGVNRGFHMGEDYLTIDISLEDDPRFTTLTWDMAMDAERLANEIIWRNVPITSVHYDTRAEAEGLPLRKALAFDEDITIVFVGDRSEPEDCVACCGTHPKRSGQVGVIKILKLEANKGMTRVYCEAGERAWRLFRSEHDILSELNHMYSASTFDLIEKIGQSNAKAAADRDALFALRRSLIESYAEKAEALVAAGGGPSCESGGAEDGDCRASIPVLECGLDPEDMMQLGKRFIRPGARIALINRELRLAMLFSGDASLDCGRFVRENAIPLGGKGGGRDTNARAAFSSSESLEAFTELL